MNEQELSGCVSCLMNLHHTHTPEHVAVIIGRECPM